jgi:hypothetical protein
MGASPMKKWISTALSIILVFILSLSAIAASRPSPDFTNPAAVIADLNQMKQEGQAKKASLVVVKCNYAINVINNFMRLNPGGDPSILKQRWQEAYEEYQKLK